MEGVQSVAVVRNDTRGPFPILSNRFVALSLCRSAASLPRALPLCAARFTAARSFVHPSSLPPLAQPPLPRSTVTRSSAARSLVNPLLFCRSFYHRSIFRVTGASKGLGPIGVRCAVVAGAEIETAVPESGF